jgi:hypothetical protein
MAAGIGKARDNRKGDGGIVEGQIVEFTKNDSISRGCDGY